MTELPQFAIICGIGYNVTVHEGMVIFEEAICMFGCHTRLCFERADEPGGGLWYLSFSDTWGHVPVKHVLKAYELLCEVYGDSFQEKKPV